jgi:hypothetical protein
MMQLNEEEIEEVVELSLIALHREFMEGMFNKREYDMAVTALQLWAKERIEDARRTVQ